VWGWQVLRKLAVTKVEALEGSYSMLVPALCAVLQQTQGPTKLAAERTLSRLLQVQPSQPSPPTPGGARPRLLPTRHAC
jgi:hypothetical protein